MVLAGICLALPLLARADLPAGDGVEVAMLLYEEQEAGTDVYPVRVLVNDRHVRIDDGNDSGDFVLLERATRRLSSVNHDERNILVIDYRAAAAELPPDLELSQEQTTDPAAPAIQGKRPVNFRLLANGGICQQLVVVPGLLDTAVSGLAEYERVLAARQLHSMETVPKSVQTPCFLSRYAYAPARHLEHGLPLQEYDWTGYRRSLVDFKASLRVAAALFRLPDGYAEFGLD
jgi:hypothetical protein